MCCLKLKIATISTVTEVVLPIFTAKDLKSRLHIEIPLRLAASLEWTFAGLVHHHCCSHLGHIVVLPVFRTLLSALIKKKENSTNEYMNSVEEKMVILREVVSSRTCSLIE